MRVAMGCAYESVPIVTNDVGEIVPPQAIWKHAGDDTAGTTICSGFTANLPDVIDIARAHRHWSKGELGTVTGGNDGLPGALVDGLEILDDAVSRYSAWKMKQGGEKS